MKRPDLLYSAALRGQEVPGLRQALTFGFERGVDEARLCRLALPPMGETYFKRAAFANDLFLEDLIRGTFPVICEGRALDRDHKAFLNLLVAPPKRHEDVAFRQGIFQELTDEPERRALVESAYKSILAFQEALCGSDHFSAKTVGVRRRIDILTSLRRSLDDLFAATSSSRSGLERIALWIEGFRSEDRYARLERLLDFEGGRSVLETRLQVGYDGGLRRFDVVKTTEMHVPPFPRNRLVKFFRRLFSLMKGYRFSEEDIMSHLLDQVFTGLEGEVIELLGLSVHLEFYLRGLAFREICEEKGLKVCLPELLAADAERQPRRLIDLFNPWLVAGEGRVVPCSLEQREARVTTIVTGPNSGGKTRLMQSLAATQLLAQGGLFVPAAEAKLPAVEHLFLSLLEHAGASQSEGRLGLELMRIREVFESSGPSALVIMDELCSGTNPSEGERIFEMVLGLFEELEPQVLITTHFLDFAADLQKKNGGSLEFLQVEISDRDVPTYQFKPGVAETSLARNTAARLGVTREELLGLIEAHKLRRQQRD